MACQRRRTTDEFVANSREVSEHDDVYDLEPGHTADEPRVRRIELTDDQQNAYMSLFPTSSLFYI